MPVPQQCNVICPWKYSLKCVFKEKMFSCDRGGYQDMCDCRLCSQTVPLIQLYHITTTPTAHAERRPRQVSPTMPLGILYKPNNAPGTYCTSPTMPLGYTVQALWGILYKDHNATRVYCTRITMPLGYTYKDHNAPGVFCTRITMPLGILYKPNNAPETYRTIHTMSFGAYCTSPTMPLGNTVHNGS